MEREYITQEKISSLNLPDDLKQALIGLIEIRPKFEQLRIGPTWNRLIHVILTNAFKEERPEWVKLFSVTGKHFEPVKGNYDPLNKPVSDLQLSQEDSLTHPCEGCIKS